MDGLIHMGTPYKLVVIRRSSPYELFVNRRGAEQFTFEFVYVPKQQL